MKGNIMDLNNEPKAIKNDSYPASAKATVAPDPVVIEYTRRNGRKEGLLYNNRLHCFGRGDGKVELKKPDEYNANRDWILENFPT